MILKIPVVIGDETVIGLFHRDHVSVALPRDKGEATALHVHGIMEPFLARVPHAIMSQFIARAHAENHGSMDVQGTIDKAKNAKPEVRDAVVDRVTGERRPHPGNSRAADLD